MITHAEWLSSEEAEDIQNQYETKKQNALFSSSPKSCEIRLIHPDNAANVSPIFHQDDHIILMDWEDVEGDHITYSLEIWNEIELSTIDYYQLTDSYKYLIVDNLKTGDTFIWQVKAMNQYGVVCQSQTRSFIKTDPSVPDAGTSYIFTKDDKCLNLIKNSTIQAVSSSYKIKILQPQNTFFHVGGPFGEYQLNVTAPNYQPKQMVLVHESSKENHWLLTKTISLKDLIKVLKLITGYSENYDCLDEIDFSKNQKVDLGDVIYLINNLSD